MQQIGVFVIVMTMVAGVAAPPVVQAQARAQNAAASVRVFEGAG